MTNLVTLTQLVILSQNYAIQRKLVKNAGTPPPIVDASNHACLHSLIWRNGNPDRNPKYEYRKNTKLKTQHVIYVKQEKRHIHFILDYRILRDIRGGFFRNMTVKLNTKGSLLFKSARGGRGYGTAFSHILCSSSLGHRKTISEVLG